jgi:hypothetical protein
MGGELSGVGVGPLRLNGRDGGGSDGRRWSWTGGEEMTRPEGLYENS